MKPEQIPCYRLVEFGEALENNPELLNDHPCVISDFTSLWQASSRWTNLDYLSSLFGGHPVTAGAPQFTTHKQAKMCQVRTDFGTYLRYVREPERFETLFKNSWVKGDAELFRELNLPLYCGNLRIVKHADDRVFSDIDPVVPPPLVQLNKEIPYFYQCGNHLWLYVSVAGALTPLHQDNNSVSAYLAQLHGSKRAILYSPDDKHHFYNPSVGYLDPLSPNEVEFPTWREAQRWDATLNPGELLIWGPNWAHHVVTLSQSITISFDFVDFSNLQAYTQSRDWRFELGRFAKANKEMIRARIQNRSSHLALDSASEEELGRDITINALQLALQSQLSPLSRTVKEQMLAALSKLPAFETVPVSTVSSIGKPGDAAIAPRITN